VKDVLLKQNKLLSSFFEFTTLSLHQTFADEWWLQLVLKAKIYNNTDYLCGPYNVGLYAYLGLIVTDYCTDMQTVQLQ